MDYLLFLTVAAICAFGVVMLFSASYYYAQSFQGDGYYYVKKQLLFLAIGIPVMFGLSFVDYKFYRRFAWMAYLLIILLLIAVLLFGKNLQGGQRWLKIGPLQFQPSELAKFIIVICMAKYMTDHHEDMPSFVRGLLPMAALLVVPAVLIYFQPNVSMLIILCIVFAIMLFIGGASLSQLGIAALIGGAALVVLLFAASYRESRFTAWLDPWGNKSDAGYQIVQSLYAFGNGGWFGQGLDASRQKLLFLPYRESDFILSIIAEELGFVTVALLIAAYCFIIYRGIRSRQVRFTCCGGVLFHTCRAGCGQRCRCYKFNTRNRANAPLHQLRRYLACYIPCRHRRTAQYFTLYGTPKITRRIIWKTQKTETAAAITNLSTAAGIPATVLRTLQAIPHTVPAVRPEHVHARFRTVLNPTGWIPAQRHPHAASATRKSGGDKTDVTFSVRSEFFFLSHCLGFAVIQPTALPALTRSLFPEAGNTVPNR